MTKLDYTMFDLMGLLMKYPKLELTFNFDGGPGYQPEGVENTFTVKVQHRDTYKIFVKRWTMELHQMVVLPYRFIMESLVEELRKEGMIT